MNIDWKGVESLLKKECVWCNVNLKHQTNSKCEDCHFGGKSTQRKSKKVTQYTQGIQPYAIFKKYGIPDNWGKCQLYYFYHNQDLNGEYPQPVGTYIIDIFGKTVKINKGGWLLHHEDGCNWNDSTNNLLLCLRNEHKFFEDLTQRRLND